jgi:Ca2+-binding RTX toxin-like protein
MKHLFSFLQAKPGFSKLTLATLCSSLLILQGCGSSNSSDAAVANEAATQKIFTVQVGTDLNSKTNALLAENPSGPGGSPNQSLRAGDVLQGGVNDDLLIGGLGVDILIGEAGDDILIGGTEDFNSSVDGDDKGADNRDRAFGQEGDDVFVWAPGDGSDFFDGGEGIDVVIFGIVGELQDAGGLTEGAPFFNVNALGAGSQDFDGIYLDEFNQPQIRVSNTPGFCSLVDTQSYAAELALLDVDQIVRFSLRDFANAFDAGDRSDDDGLRVSVTLKNTEFVVCTTRDFDAENGLANIEVLDIRSGVPVLASLSDLPAYVQALIQ